MSKEGGQVRAVILDWAGTTVDFGSRAPARVFVEIFAQRGVAITEVEARGPMGRAKRAHIAAVIHLPRVSEVWKKIHGKPPGDDDIDAMYAEFLPLQKETLARQSAVIPGVAAAIERLRRAGIRIGSTTGYTRELMEVVSPLAAREGYSPEVVVCSDEVPEGRPAPWMNFLAAQRLGVYPMTSVVIVDDTPVGVEAALHAGAIAVAVSKSGNALGLSENECHALPPGELRDRLTAIEREFLAMGAHAVIPTVADLPDLLAARSLGGGK